MVRVEWNGDKIVKEFLSKKEPYEKKNAETIASAAKRNAPYDTGKLRDSIRVVKSKFKDGGYMVLVGDEEAYYANFQEYGTPRIPAKSFTRRAMLTNWKKFKDDLEQLMDSIK